jgi:hypothetical protein
MKSRALVLLAGIICLVLLSGCFVFTDGATRLAGDLRSGAADLRSSPLQTLEVEHRPSSLPDGVDGPYRILLLATTDATRSRALVVEEVEAKPGRRARGWATTYHTNFVSVPKELSIQKGKGEPTILVLRKVGDVIEVESVR